MTNLEFEQSQEDTKVPYNIDEFKRIITKSFLEATPLRDESVIGVIQTTYLFIEQISHQVLVSSDGKYSAELAKDKYAGICIQLGDTLSASGTNINERNYHALAAACFREAYRALGENNPYRLEAVISFTQSFCNYQVDMQPDEVKQNLWIQNNLTEYLRVFPIIERVYLSAARIETAVLSNNVLAQKF